MWSTAGNDTTILHTTIYCLQPFFFKTKCNVSVSKLEEGSHLHIQTVTPAGHMLGLRSNSAGPSSSCRMGSRTQSGIQGSDPGPESPEASGGHTPSGGAVLQDKSQTDNLNLNRNKLNERLWTSSKRWSQTSKSWAFMALWALECDGGGKEKSFYLMICNWLHKIWCNNRAWYFNINTCCICHSWSQNGSYCSVSQSCRHLENKQKKAAVERLTF